MLDAARDRPPRRGEPIPTSSSTNASHAVEQYGLATALKLSEDISDELLLESLTETLLRTAIEQTGAERVWLMVPSGDEVRVEAEAVALGDRVTVHIGEHVNNTSFLPETVLRSVLLNQQAVLLHDAANALAVAAS